MRVTAYGGFFARSEAELGAWYVALDGLSPDVDGITIDDLARSLEIGSLIGAEMDEEVDAVDGDEEDDVEDEGEDDGEVEGEYADESSEIPDYLECDSGAY